MAMLPHTAGCALQLLAVAAALLFALCFLQYRSMYEEPHMCIMTNSNHLYTHVDTKVDVLQAGNDEDDASFKSALFEYKLHHLEDLSLPDTTGRRPHVDDMLNKRHVFEAVTVNGDQIGYPPLQRGKNADRLPRDHLHDGIPVLFVHGNSGSFQEGRGVGHSTYDALRHHHDKMKGDKKGMGIDVWATDFEEEANIHNGRVLLQHALFVNYSASYLINQFVAFHRAKREVPLTDEEEKVVGDVEENGIWLVGHSMGGLVSRLVPLLSLTSWKDNNHVGNSPLIRGIITISSPHRMPPIMFDSSLYRIYREISIAWSVKPPQQSSSHFEEVDVEKKTSMSSPASVRQAWTLAEGIVMGHTTTTSTSGGDKMLKQLQRVWHRHRHLNITTPLLSIANGFGDNQVQHATTTVASAVVNGRDVSSLELQGAGSMMTHHSVTWCSQLMTHLGPAVMKLVTAPDTNSIYNVMPTAKRLSLPPKKVPKSTATVYPVKPLAHSEVKTKEPFVLYAFSTEGTATLEKNTGAPRVVAEGQDDDAQDDWALVATLDVPHRTALPSQGFAELFDTNHNDNKEPSFVRTLFVFVNAKATSSTTGKMIVLSDHVLSGAYVAPVSALTMSSLPFYAHYSIHFTPTTAPAAASESCPACATAPFRRCNPSVFTVPQKLLLSDWTASTGSHHRQKEEEPKFHQRYQFLFGPYTEQPAKTSVHYTWLPDRGLLPTEHAENYVMLPMIHDLQHVVTSQGMLVEASGKAWSMQVTAAPLWAMWPHAAITAHWLPYIVSGASTFLLLWQLGEAAQCHGPFFAFSFSKAVQVFFMVVLVCRQLACSPMLERLLLNVPTTLLYKFGGSRDVLPPPPVFEQNACDHDSHPGYSTAAQQALLDYPGVWEQPLQLFLLAAVCAVSVGVAVVLRTALLLLIRLVSLATRCLWTWKHSAVPNFLRSTTKHFEAMEEDATLSYRFGCALQAAVLVWAIVFGSAALNVYRHESAALFIIFFVVVGALGRLHAIEAVVRPRTTGRNAHETSGLDILCILAFLSAFHSSFIFAARNAAVSKTTSPIAAPEQRFTLLAMCFALIPFFSMYCSKWHQLVGRLHRKDDVDDSDDEENVGSPTRDGATIMQDEDGLRRRYAHRQDDATMHARGESHGITVEGTDDAKRQQPALPRPSWASKAITSFICSVTLVMASSAMARPTEFFRPTEMIGVVTVFVTFSHAQCFCWNRMKL